MDLILLACKAFICGALATFVILVALGYIAHIIRDKFKDL
jgi:hypothetical protein